MGEDIKWQAPPSMGPGDEFARRAKKLEEWNLETIYRTNPHAFRILQAYAWGHYEWEEALVELVKQLVLENHRMGLALIDGTMSEGRIVHHETWREDEEE